MDELMEAIIEALDDFHSEMMAREITRAMREVALRGFWLTSRAPYGYRRVYVQDGAKQRPRLEPDPPADGIVRRMFRMAESGVHPVDIARSLNQEGITSPGDGLWGRASVRHVLLNEAYTGTLIWGTNAKDGAPPVRVESAFEAIVPRERFDRVAQLPRERPYGMHPCRAA